MTAEKTGLGLLRQPFPEHQVNQLPKQVKRDDQDKGKCEKGTRYSADGVFCGGWHARSLHLDFVGHAALTDRLLDADPEWSWEPVAWGPDGLPAFDKLGGLWIRLTVCGVTRLGYGDAQGKTGPNAVKEAIGDALRNAGMRFGAALDLWHKGDLHEARGEQEAPEKKAERIKKPTKPVEDEWTAPEGQEPPTPSSTRVTDSEWFDQWLQLVLAATTKAEVDALREQAAGKYREGKVTRADAEEVAEAIRLQLDAIERAEKPGWPEVKKPADAA